MFNNISFEDELQVSRPVAPATRAVTLSTAHIGPFYAYAKGASLLKASKGKCDFVTCGPRGVINGFSRAARRRLMLMIATIRRDAELPSFLTLTYPQEFPTVERAKRDQDVFYRRMTREFKGWGAIWKLEPQQRGAPHFHKLLYGLEVENVIDWVADNWYEIAGNGDKNHWRFHMGMLPGSQPCVQPVRSWRGVWSYASKYLGKTFEVAEWGSQWTGRFWGVEHRENVPFGEVLQLPAERSGVVQLMRLQRRFSGLKLPRSGNLNSLTIFCDADQWVDKLDLRGKNEIFE